MPERGLQFRKLLHDSVASQSDLGQCDDGGYHEKRGKRGEEFSRVKSSIRTYCEDYQKEMASAEIFNANIISRLLGLADKQMVKNEEKIVIVNSQEEMDKLNRLKDIED